MCPPNLVGDILNNNRKELPNINVAYRSFSVVLQQCTNITSKGQMAQRVAREPT